MEVASLFKTHQDAIAFCRRLRMQYLWIDAVCIVQDDPQDWLRELTKMDKYYGDNLLSLAATSSENSDAGCNAHTNPVEFTGRGRDNRPYSLSLRPEINHIAHGDFDHEQRAGLFLLLNRAWCYQERCLAPRVLHFTGNELAFECAEMNACECGQPGSRVSSASWTKVKEAFYVKNFDISTISDERERARLERFAIARGFSSLNLTYASDRLPAISGLAKRQKENMDRLKIPSGRYLAGLWKNQLIDGMSWCVGKDLIWLRKEGKNKGNIGVTAVPIGPEMPKPKDYIAPSWSWASVLDPVQYNAPFSKPLCTIVHAETSLATGAPFGQVKGGSITLRGKLRKCHGEWVTTGFLPNYWGLPDLPGTKLRLCMKWYPDYNIDTLKGKRQDLFLMPLTSRPRAQRHRIVATVLSMGDLTIYLLLINKGKRTYERVGWAYTNGQAIDMRAQKQVEFNIV